MMPQFNENGELIVLDTTNVELMDAQTLTPENKELLTKFSTDNVKGFDKNGNLIGSDGKIFKTVEDLKQFGNAGADTVEQVEIDGVTLTIDKEGNALGTDGTIKYTKDQLAEFEEDSETTGIKADEVYKLTGVQIVNEKNEPVEYDFTSAQGIAKYTTDTWNQQAKELAVKAQQDFFKANPDLYEAYLYKTNKGTLEGFGNRESFKDIVIDKANIDQQVDIIVKGQLARGNTIEFAKKFADYAKSANDTEDLATKELVFLKEKELSERATAEKRISDEKIAADKDWETYVNSVTDVVKKGVLGEYTLPEKFTITKDGKTEVKSKEDFVNYYIKPAWQGEDGSIFTTYEKDLMEQTLEQKLIDAAIRFSGGKSDFLVKSAVNKEKVNVIRKLRKASDTANSNSKTNTSKAGKVILD